jgi:hypothetical protein
LYLSRSDRLTIPFFGTVYGLSGIASFVWGTRRRESLQALGITIAFVGAFNAYSEEWKILSHLNIALPVFAGFLCAYTVLLMRLMGEVGIEKPGTAFAHSFLPVVYALGVSFAYFLPGMLKTDENPPLTLYVYLLLILAIHVPTFAFGKSRAIESGAAPSQSSDTFRLPSYFACLWPPLLVLMVPLVVCLLIQLVSRGDWKLFWLNDNRACLAVCDCGTRSEYAVRSRLTRPLTALV